METWMITGTTGFLGSRIAETLKKDPEKRVLAIPRQEMDFTRQEDVVRAFEKYRPDVLVHSAAQADTGICERNPETTEKINVEGVRYLAKEAGELGCKMIFMSSDQVYTGTKGNILHLESESLSPINVYGRQKLRAEELVDQYTNDGVSLRLTWMYDLPDGKLPIKPNFVLNLLELIRRGGIQEVSSRDYRSVTDGKLVADNIGKCRNLPKGSYNFGSSNKKSFFETTGAVLELLGKAPEQYLRETVVERNLSINIGKIEQQGLHFPDTMEGVRNCLKASPALAEKGWLQNFV